MLGIARNLETEACKTSMFLVILLTTASYGSSRVTDCEIMKLFVVAYISQWPW